ncbi:PDZ domain-containing protein [uncultured Flavobacterium sp.]|uniref:S41 family peptidase n=1 Tax=uncultured Flavobacterium sp. TaxID=165435 RepID=UPI0030CA57D6
MKKLFNFSILHYFCILLTGLQVFAQESRLLRSPSISHDKISFVYAADIWVANKDGSNVERITAFDGVEANPHFSPNGQSIAFTGEYDGNMDVYVVSVNGGDPKRLTWHPGVDKVTGWSNDGTKIIFSSGRKNAPFPNPDQLWEVSVEGNNPTPFNLPRAANGKFSPDGLLFVYEQISPWETEFKNYRGGQNNPLRIFDLKTYATQKLPWENSRDIDPVWMDDTIYFLSDRDFTMNIWAYSTQSKTVNQVTFFKEFDCKNLEGDNVALIFENGGYLYTLALGSDKPVKLTINVTGDFPWTRLHWSKIEKYIESTAISPNGKRIALSGRGDVFTIPAKKGNPRNISNSQGIADRAVAWSPDGKSISWFSDEGGEYQLVIADQFGKEKRIISIENPTFYYKPSWSPDSKYLSFYNENRTLWIVEVSSGKFTEIASEGFAHPEHVIYGEWAPDSKWIAYTKRLSNEYSSIFIYSLDQKKSFQITDGMANCKMPAWDKSGKYIYFMASIDYGMNVGWLDMSSFDHPVTSSIYMAVLSKETLSPLAPESDDEVPEKDKATETDKTKYRKKKSDEAQEKEVEKKIEPVKIDFEGLQQRIIALPVPSRVYIQLETAKDGVLFYSEQIPSEEGLSLNRFTLEKRKSEKVVDGISGFEIAAEGEKYLYVTKSNQFVISKVTEKPDLAEETLSISDVKIKVDPILEWQQIFREAWRYQRDYFYVENIHGLDMNWAYKTYSLWVDHVKHRSDLNYVLDVFSGETSIGHSFVRGGDYPEVDKVPTGLLGADFIIENGMYRIKKIYNGESWNAKMRSPLSGPGINVKEGDYLLALNGVPLNTTTNLYSYFAQTAEKQITISTNTTPVLKDAKKTTVVPVSSEYNLRQQDWIESNRRKVDKLSNGKLAYVWLPDTGEGGYTNFNRYYFAQKNKKGAIIDERFNNGGSIADYITDLLSRELLGYFNNPTSDKQSFTSPNAGIWGPKVMIINEMAGSGGDMLPYMFKMRKIGPLVGTKTWGGLVGIWDVPNLIDGGSITAPRGGFYNTKGEWDVENIGVAPDIMVEQDAKLVIDGHDPQLEKAVQVAMELLKTQEINLLPQPKDPIRVIKSKN